MINSVKVKRLHNLTGRNASLISINKKVLLLIVLIKMPHNYVTFFVTWRRAV